MTEQFFEQVLEETLKQTKEVLGVKAKEYRRNNNPMHNFEVAARIKKETREQAMYGMSIKHEVSIIDIRNDVEKGLLPDEETVNEKFGDMINYLILEKASILDKIKNKN